MPFETLVHDRHRRSIPLNQIAETRARFGRQRIFYEIDLETDDAWRGLEATARAFGRSGLVPVSVRLLRNGRIWCKIADRPLCDISILDNELSQVGDLRIIGWTTVIEAADQA